MTATASNGIVFAPRFYLGDGHPFDDVNWQISDARLTNFRDGGVAFEQLGVEFPDYFSVNARNIVADKYFRGGPVGSPNREGSLRQVLTRVPGWYTEQGVKDGYFAPGSAEVFRRELTALGLGQVMAFNSPVWFNVGVEPVPRVAACFILDVDDSLTSIVDDWYRTEAFIFREGSGSGIDISNLRGRQEPTKRGGRASGPVSFMRGADAQAGTIKSGGSTRRAAKMVVLWAGHPDIREFIQCKVREERKARVLREAGFDVDIDGDDWYGLQFQNANNSVRCPDELFERALAGQDWELRAVVTGEVLETVAANDLLNEIAAAAWECADPGVFFHDTMQRWHTSPCLGPIRSTNPCGEFVRPAWTSCNLASLRLTKFNGPDGFDVPAFTSAVETTITAMDISVTNSEYPDSRITEMVANYRELGIGYADLGALLMEEGLPYDSDDGRAFAAAITALMTGVAYRRSAELASVLGPYPGWHVGPNEFSDISNAEAHMNVMRQHRAALDQIDAELVPAGVLEAARAEWDLAIELGGSSGYRNAQVSLLAPTGTISFLMDCDTTGIEPDLSLVKNKKLVGGGQMTIVNQRLSKALVKLGYDEQTVAGIEEYVEENNTVHGAPGMDPTHYPVFDTAIGDHAISYMGHIRMMAAVQPFLSGAISKTVNLPASATIEDMRDVILTGWRLGLKNLAVYRDNSKAAQPLSAATKEAPSNELSAKEVEERFDEIVAPFRRQIEDLMAELERARTTHFRRRMPHRRRADAMPFDVAGLEGYLHVGLYEDGSPGEIFIKLAKQGSTLAGVFDAFAIVTSIALQYGAPLRVLVDKFINMNFPPNGMVTGDSDLRMASSVVDYLFRRLAIDYLTFQDRAELGIFTVEERMDGIDKSFQDGTLDPNYGISNAGPVRNNGSAPVSVQPALQVAAATLIKQVNGYANAQLCSNCGNPMQRAGSCFACSSCGTTSGCS